MDPYEDQDGSPEQIALYERLQVSTVDATPGIPCPKDKWIADWMKSYGDDYDYLQNIASSLRREKGWHHVWYRELLYFTFRTDIRDKEIEALQQCHVPLKRLRLHNTHYWEYCDDDGRPEPMPSRHETLTTACMLGQALGSHPSLKEVIFDFSMPSDLYATSMLAAVGGACRQCQLLTVDCDASRYDEDPEPDYARVLSSAFRGHPSMKTIVIKRARTTAFLKGLLEHASTMSSLKTIVVCGCSRFDLHTEGELPILQRVTDEDADMIRRVFHVDSLRHLDLPRLILETETATDIICNGFAESNVKDLKLSSFSFPSSKGAAVAEALLGSKLKKLNLNFDVSTVGDDFLRVWGQGLGSSALRVLELKVDNCEGWRDWVEWQDNESDVDDDVFRALLDVFLENAPDWKLRKFTLTIAESEWTEYLEASLAAYIAGSECLRTLTLVCPLGEDGVYSEALLDAVALGNGSLDEVELRGGGFDEDWVEEMKEAVAANLNRQKRIHGRRFDAIALNKPGASRRLALMDAFGAIDAITLYEFLRGNEWLCRDILLQETPREATSRKRGRSAYK
jgi:hypothetical protein